MKTASLYQPWATLTAIRAKKIETRGWQTKYRGPLAIHASLEKKYIDLRSKHYICDMEPFYSVLMEATQKEGVCVPWYKILPRGVVIAICDLEDCVPIEDDPPYIIKNEEPNFISDQEKAFGNYTLGRFMWFLENVRELKHPIPAKGARLLWDWTPPQDLEFK